MRDSIAAFWCRIPSRANFGDALTPWLIERIQGHYPRFRTADASEHKYLVTGSIIGLARAPCTVWGSGIMNADDVIAPDLELRSVRGPLTRARALHLGLECPAIFGDPALLLPRWYDPRTSQQFEIGLAPHFSDYPNVCRRGDVPDDIHLIDMQWPIERVIDHLSSCKLVATSSLHGLIVSHAYGVPATWIRFRALPSGDDSKFRDYLASIGSDIQSPVVVTPLTLERASLRRHAIRPPRSGHLDLDGLWNACPFRNAP